MTIITVDLENLKRLREELDEAIKKQNECEAENKELKESNEELKEEIATLQQKIEKIKIRNVQLHRQYTETIILNSKFKEMIESLKNELKSWNPWEDPPRY